MARERFPQPDSVRRQISDGDYIDIKKCLTHGEREDMFARMSPHIIVGEQRRIDTHEVRTAKVVTYLLGWSLMNNGKPVPMSPDLPEQVRIDTIRSLDTETFDEIHAEIEAHELSMFVARSEKKRMNGAVEPPVISASPSGVVGAMNGSATSTPTCTTS